MCQTDFNNPVVPDSLFIVFVTLYVVTVGARGREGKPDKGFSVISRELFHATLDYKFAVEKLICYGTYDST